eukprot:TRINITY_DN3861_c0_g2_i1.p1 TRINITY_DN3861_c0_g2~~TRINITY_DN3861_c0_g2_i1.p1  ORF type:complete len:160 (-),score=70.02 TRINITY_DN3861_c0_g2_i1:266-691(-)
MITLPTMKYIQENCLPTFINGSWRKPKISAMKLAKYRKLAALTNTPWVEPVRKNTIVEKPEKTFYPRGTKHERTYLKRQISIHEKLKQIPKTMEQLKKDKKKKIHFSGLEWIIKDKIFTPRDYKQEKAAAAAAASSVKKKK